MLRRRMLIMLGVVALVIVALAAYKGFSIYKMVQKFSAPKPPISIAAARAEQRAWQSRLPAIGSLKGFQGVELTAEVAGTVKSVQFDSGEKVGRGQPIVELDSAVEQASLATAEASMGLARLEFERGKNLINRQAISKSEFDRLNAELQKADASVAQLRATLAKKRILAPFAGTIGIRQVDVGTYVSPGTVIATLQDISTLFVDFFLPEQSAPRLAIGQRLQLTVAAYPDEAFVGEIVAINPKVETATRNLLVRARLANPQGKLLPGMFANLQVLLPDPQQRILVPETAVTFTLYGNSLYVIKEQAPEQAGGADGAATEPQLLVERRFVETGERRDGQVVVLKGLENGEQVVTAGQLKLDDGSAVRIAEDPLEHASQARGSHAN